MQDTWNVPPNQSPSAYFANRVAEQAVGEIVAAKRSLTTAPPISTSGYNPVTAEPTTKEVPDPIAITRIARTACQVEGVQPLLSASRAVRQIVSELPKAGFFGDKPGLYEESLEERLTYGNTPTAEALFLRAAIVNDDLRHAAKPQEFLDETFSFGINTAAIASSYNVGFKRDLRKDIQDAVGARLTKPY